MATAGTFVGAEIFQSFSRDIPHRDVSGYGRDVNGASVWAIRNHYATMALNDAVIRNRQGASGAGGGLTGK